MVRNKGAVDLKKAPDEVRRKAESHQGLCLLLCRFPGLVGKNFYNNSPLQVAVSFMLSNSLWTSVDMVMSFQMSRMV